MTCHCTFLLVKSVATPCRWLMQRASGIQLLQYTPGPRYLPVGRLEEPLRYEITIPDMRRKQETIRDVVPKVTTQLSPEAVIEMNLKFGEMHST